MSVYILLMWYFSESIEKPCKIGDPNAKETIPSFTSCDNTERETRRFQNFDTIPAITK